MNCSIICCKIKIKFDAITFNFTSMILKLQTTPKGQTDTCWEGPNKQIYIHCTYYVQKSALNSKNEIMNRKSTQAFKVIIMIKPSYVPSNLKKTPSKNASWPENMHIIIFRVQPCWIALYQWRSEKSGSCYTYTRGLVQGITDFIKIAAYSRVLLTFKHWFITN